MTQPVLRLVQIPLNFPYRAIGQAPGLRSDLRNEPSAFRQRHFLCSMVWLPERIIESLHEMHALAAQNHRLVPFEAHGHERSPTRMRAKSYRHTFHGSLPVGEEGHQACNLAPEMSRRGGPLRRASLAPPRDLHFRFSPLTRAL